MCAIKLNKILYRGLIVINLLKRDLPHPLVNPIIRSYSIFVKKYLFNHYKCMC